MIILFTISCNIKTEETAINEIVETNDEISFDEEEKKFIDGIGTDSAAHSSILCAPKIESFLNS